MTWSPVPPLEVFAETLSVPAWIHTRPGPVKVLVLGDFATPLATLALRFPDTQEVMVVGDEQVTPRDRRVTRLATQADLPADYQADVSAVALPGTPKGALVTQHRHTTPDGVAVIAVDDAANGRRVKNDLRDLWAHVLPYRTYAPDLALFFLASNRKLGASTRGWPANLKKLCPPYLSSLFALARDEYQLLYGAET